MDELKLKNDREFRIYTKGLAKGHITPSEATLALFKKMEDKFNKLEDKVSSLEVNIVKELGSIKLDIVNEINKMKCNIEDSCEEKYSPIWAADSIKFIIVAFFSLLVLTIWSMVTK